VPRHFRVENADVARNIPVQIGFPLIQKANYWGKLEDLVYRPEQLVFACIKFSRKPFDSVGVSAEKPVLSLK
jgi:hypothetical protein